MGGNQPVGLWHFLDTSNNVTGGSTPSKSCWTGYRRKKCYYKWQAVYYKVRMATWVAGLSPLEICHYTFISSIQSSLCTKSCFKLVSYNFVGRTKWTSQLEGILCEYYLWIARQYRINNLQVSNLNHHMHWTENVLSLNARQASRLMNALNLKWMLFHLKWITDIHITMWGLDVSLG